MTPAPRPPSAHRHRVLQLLLCLPEAGDEEATAGPPEQALQGGGLVGLHGACHEAAGQAGLSGAAPTAPCIALRPGPAHGGQPGTLALPPGRRQDPIRQGQNRRNPHAQEISRPEGGGGGGRDLDKESHLAPSLRASGVAEKSVKLPLTYLTLRSWWGPLGGWSRGVLSEEPSVWVAAN